MFDLGTSCKKYSYEILDIVDQVCEDGQTLENDLCFSQCNEGFESYDYLCMTPCPYQDHYDCGAVCTGTENFCYDMIQ
jgi:hypothetical protein